jgi:hypothetical protein
MNFSKREKIILLLVGLAVLVFAGDRYVLTPFMQQRDDLATQLATDAEKMRKAHQLFDANRNAVAKWNLMLTSGLKADASSAESQMLHSLQNWAQESGMHPPSVKPERSEQDKQFRKIVFRATGEGSMDSIAQFLYRIQTSTIPARVTDIQLAAKKENTDDLTVTIGVSTLFLAPEASSANLTAAVSTKELQ